MLLSLLLALAVVLALAAFAAWYVGVDPDRVSRPAGAALTDAAERTADLAANFRDWLRLGR